MDPGFSFVFLDVDWTAYRSKNRDKINFEITEFEF